jgi:hypothetical protein
MQFALPRVQNNASAVIAHFKHLKDLGQNHPIGIKINKKDVFL